MSDRVAAFHEAGHAVVAVYSRVIDLAGPVDIDSFGGGSANLRQNNGSILAELGSEFDPDDVHERFAAAFVAGPIAERLLVEAEELPVTEADTDHAGRFDRQMAEDRLMTMERSLGMPELLSTTHTMMSGWMWLAITEFAEELLVRRHLSADAAMAFAEACIARHEPAEA